MFKNAILASLTGGLITWGLTTLGSALVFLFLGGIKKRILSIMYGFAAGVMVAASFWSLLLPAIDLSSKNEITKWLIPTLGFLLGTLFIWILDKILPHMHFFNGETLKEGPNTKLSQLTLLFLAITVHNIPEGLAVGVAFGAYFIGDPNFTLASAMALTIGIGIQNFPEGAALSLPLVSTGVSKWKSFLLGSLSAIVEPISAVIGAIAVTKMQIILPLALAFAAGAMIYVVVEELVPEAVDKQDNHAGVFGFIIGFTIMMILDVSLG